MPSLRGHHLICLHFFNGEGYNPEFLENLTGIIRTAENREVEIHAGADDICKKCPHLRHDRCSYNEDSYEEVRGIDNIALDLLKLSEGEKVGWKDIEGRIPEIFKSWYAAYCTACGWKWACEKKPFYQTLKSNHL